MIVIRVSRMDGFTSTVCAGDPATADQRWAALIDKACQCAEQKRLAVELSMQEVEAAEEAAAVAACEAGQGRRIKAVTVKPPRDLLVKVREGGPNAVTEAVLARSQAVIDDKAAGYPALARLDLVTLHDLAGVVGAAETTDAERADALKRLYEVAYRVKGQAGTFGYPHVTAVAHHLYVMARVAKASPEKLGEAIQVHVDAMQMLLNRRLTGAAPEGKAIIEALNKVVVKIIGPGPGPGPASGPDGPPAVPA